MRHNPLDTVIINVGRRVGIGQYVARIEDVKPLILHRTEVEIRDRNNVEHVEVIFTPVDTLIPGHAVFQRLHGMGGAGKIGFLHPNTQLHLTPAHGHEAVGIAGQVASHQGEKIAGLGIGVVPDGPMPTIVTLPLFDRVAIGQKYREARFVCAHMDAVPRQDIGTIGEEGNPAKTLRLALGAE